MIDNTTASANVARELHGTARKSGIGFIDAPGRQAGLTVMCGGNKCPFKKAQPVMNCYAREVTLIGGPGSRQLTKMVNPAATMCEGEFNYGFAVDCMRKDRGICFDEATSNGARLPVAALVDQFYATVQARGGKRWNTSALIYLLIDERLA